MEGHARFRAELSMAKQMSVVSGFNLAFQLAQAGGRKRRKGVGVGRDCWRLLG